MKDKNPLIEELKVLRDEIKLQAHLFTMDTRLELFKYEECINDILENSAESLGEFNEQFWVGKKSEIEEMIKSLKKIKK